MVDMKLEWAHQPRAEVPNLGRPRVTHSHIGITLAVSNAKLPIVCMKSMFSARTYHDFLKYEKL